MVYDLKSRDVMYDRLPDEENEPNLLQNQQVDVVRPAENAPNLLYDRTATKKSSQGGGGRTQKKKCVQKKGKRFLLIIRPSDSLWAVGNKVEMSCLGPSSSLSLSLSLL